MPGQSRWSLPLGLDSIFSGGNSSTTSTQQAAPISGPAPQLAPTGSGTPTLDRAEQAMPLKTFPEFNGEHHNDNDAMIRRVVAEFNAEKGFTPDHPHYLDPNLVKAWALQESGGHEDVFTSGDMMQMNVAGDWAKEKQWFGIANKHEKLDPEKSLRVALRWAYYKGEITQQKKGDQNSAGWHDTQRGTQPFTGYESKFTGWDRGLTDYNGGGVKNYAGQIKNRLKTGQ
jgi:hypothetical protein